MCAGKLQLGARTKGRRRRCLARDGRRASKLGLEQRTEACIRKKRLVALADGAGRCAVGDLKLCPSVALGLATGGHGPGGEHGRAR
jgi:hypothetical protein